MKKEKYLIGIDPDVEKSGFSTIYKNNSTIEKLKFFEIYDRLAKLQEMGISPVIYIEKGSLNKSNWHTKTANSSNFNAKIGEKTGRNFETTNKLIEMFQKFDLEFYEVKPTKRKLNAETFKNLTGITKKTNQDERDSYMLIFGK